MSDGSGDDRPEQILIIRHAEKPALVGGPAGVDENGDRHRHSLIVRGWQRAGALAPYFCAPWDPSIRRPTRVYAPPAHGPNDDHGRPFETVSPTAARLGVAIDTRFTLDDEAALVHDVVASGGVVLIGWEHNRIPSIADTILGDHVAPRRWPDDRFDVVWIFDRDPATGGYRFRQRPQMLLGDDRTSTID